MNSEKKIEVFVSKAEEGLYLPIFFEIEGRIEGITIRYDYEKDEYIEHNKSVQKHNNSIIDFSIIAPQNQYLGSSGSNRSILKFSNTSSSVGFSNPTKLEGQWTILLGAYKVPDEGINVIYTISLKEKQRRLLKGDTHTHSTGSDGKVPLNLLVDIAKNIELDYLIITDHNIFHSTTEMYTDENFTLIGGSEWTQYNGHGNFWGIDQPIRPNFSTISNEETLQFIEEGKNMGAKFVVNHPFCLHCPWLWTLDIPFDAVEIWNGGTFIRSNISAIDWWHEQLLLGKKIAVTGGSDFHSFDLFRMLGCPTTNVYAWSSSEDDILEALISGNSYISYTVNAPGIDFDQSSVIFGETYPKGHETNICFNNLKSNQTIRIITNIGVEDIKIKSNEILKNISINTESISFLRCEIIGNVIPQSTDDQIFPLMITNAIYFIDLEV